MEESVNSIRPPKREVIVIDYEESTNDEQPVAKSAKRDEEEERTSPPRAPMSSTFTAVDRKEEMKKEEESDMDDESKEKTPAPGAPTSSTFTAVARAEEIKEEEEIDMKEEPSKKSPDHPDQSPEVIELQEKVRRLEEKLEGASVVSRAAELRAEAAEIKLSLITSQLEDSKRVAENSRKVNYDLTVQNEMLRNELAAMKNERRRDKARIDELERRFAVSELAVKVQKREEGPVKTYKFRSGVLCSTNSTQFAGTLTCARIRPFHSNSALFAPDPLKDQRSTRPAPSSSLTSTGRKTLLSPMTSIMASVVKDRTSPIGSVDDQTMSKRGGESTDSSPLGAVETGPLTSASRGSGSVTGVAAALAHHLAAATPTTNRLVIIPKSTVIMGKKEGFPKSTQTPEYFSKRPVGRPPKSRDDMEVVVKRPPGRPPKNRDDGSKTTPPNSTEGVVKRRPGRPSKERDNHWAEMKKAQEKVEVKKYTDSSEDWTAFDAFLRRNYQRLSISYNEKPSNALALKIKRTLWADLTREGVPPLWKDDAARFRAEGKKREYWGSETVIEQEDRVVEDGGVGVIPLGGEKKEDSIDNGRSKKENGEPSEMPELLQEENGEEDTAVANPQWIASSVRILEELMKEPCARHFTTKDTKNEALAKVWKNCDDLKTLCEKVRGGKLGSPKDVKFAVNAFVAKANNLMVANRHCEIYQDMVKLQHMFNHRYRSVIVGHMSATASAGPNSRVCIDRSSRRRSTNSTPNDKSNTERADVSLSAAESDDEQPSTSSSSRRAARHKSGFYRRLDKGGSIG